MRTLVVMVQESGGHLSPLNHNAGRHIFPERHQELAGKRGNGRLAHASAMASDPLAEPAAERGAWLVPQPEPSQLDHGRAQPRIAGFRHPLLTINRPAAPGCWSQTCIGGHLAAIGEVSEQTL